MARRMSGSPKARRPKASVKPQLETLEDRTLPSASPVQTEVSAAISQWDQMLTLVQQDISKEIQAVEQAIADVVSLLDARFGTPGSSTAPVTPSPPSPATPPAPSTSTGASAASGSSATTPFTPPPIKQPPNLIAHPMLSGGGTTTTSGGGTTATSGSSGSSGSSGTGGSTSGSGGGLGGGGSGGGIYTSAGMPIGLTDVGQLALYFLTGSVPYAETHTINRSESNTVTVNQSGGGTSGTWAVTVTGSSKASDTANGSGAGTVYTSGSGGTSTTSGGGTSTSGGGTSNSSSGGGVYPSGGGTYSTGSPFLSSSETSSGNAGGNSSYTLVMSGTYSNGIFTLTGETYNATGSSNSSDTTSATLTNASGTVSDEQSWTTSDNYTESWSAGLNSSGQLVFNSYSLTEIQTSYNHVHDTLLSGGYINATSSATTTISASGQGTMGTYTGTASLDISSDTVTPTYDYPPQQSDQTVPVSGSVDLSGVIQQPSGWQWFAGATNATNYTFTGGASENATLAETATWKSSNNGPTLVVNAFNSYYQSTDTSHVVDTEPQTPASPGGSDSFQRNETYGSSTTVTGNGSYGLGMTNASFQVVQMGTFNVADALTDDNESVSGTTGSGSAYTSNYNYGGQVSGSGLFTTTSNYQGLGNGLALTSESFQSSGSGQSSATMSGTYNGQAFNSSSTVPESFSDPQVTIPGSSTPLPNPEGVAGTFPFQDMVIPNGAVYTPPTPGVFLQVSPRVARGIGNAAQGFYNQCIEAIGEKAKKRVANLSVHNAVMQHITETQKAMDTFTLQGTNLNAQGQPVAGPRGNIFAQAVGDGKWLAEAQKKNMGVAESSGQMTKGTATLGETNVVLTYAADGASKAKRSGNVVIAYKYVQTYTGTNAKGETVTVTVPLGGPGGNFLRFHDDNLEEMSGLK